MTCMQSLLNMSLASVMTLSPLSFHIVLGEDDMSFADSFFAKSISISAFYFLFVENTSSETTDLSLVMYTELLQLLFCLNLPLV